MMKEVEEEDMVEEVLDEISKVKEEEVEAEKEVQWICMVHHQSK